MTAQPSDALVEGFIATTRRDALSEEWAFRVVWHEQTSTFAALDAQRVVGALRLRIAASLAHVEVLTVAAEYRRKGIGRELLSRAEDTANYFNCHKMTAQTMANGAAHAFFEACGYKTEAILAQHTFKLDVAFVRKFLL